jgi:4'-phosphopantetheinyl transferase
MTHPLNNTIEVWTFLLPDCTPLVADCRQVLSGEEVHRAGTFRSPNDATRFTLSRGLLRRVLGTCLDRDPAALSFKRNENGKPFLEGTDIEFNVSHSRDRLLIAVTAGRAVGVDIEFRRAGVNMSAIAGRWFSESEQQFFQTLEKPEIGFFDIWVQKEAFVKARGLGIFQGLNEFSVPLEAAGEIPTPGKTGRWFFQTLEIDPAYAAALVGKAPAVPVVLRTL